MHILRILCYNGSLVTSTVISLTTAKFKLLYFNYLKVEVKVTLRLTNDQILITVWQLRSCFCGAPSLTRGRVCLLYMLLALASAVFLGSDFLGTRDHILLSQIWAFPFRRLLRLVGSRWRYSTQPPHGFQLSRSFKQSLQHLGLNYIESPVF
jgi:hypothetical protein